MTVTTGGTYTPGIGADEVDGADITAQFTQADYVALGWDFSTVWEMGSYGYPKLRWQAGEVVLPAQTPINVSATPSFGLLDISWDAWETGGTSYEVYYSTTNSAAGATKFTTEPTVPQVTITGLSDGAVYYVWVKSKNSVGTSEYSPVPASAKTSDPLPVAFHDSSWWGSNHIDGYIIVDYGSSFPVNERWEIAYQDFYGTFGGYDDDLEWDSYGYMGFIKYVSQHSANSGVIILEYHDRDSSPLGAWETNPPPAGAKFAAVYYKSLQQGVSAEMGNANNYDEGEPNVETVTLNEAIARFAPATSRDVYYDDSVATVYDWESLE
jgi:hypothetical protein